MRARRAAPKPVHPVPLSKAGLRARGWTEMAIALFLGAPDRTARNPHYRSGPPMQLYLEPRVWAVEATPSFQAWLQGRTVRGQRAKAASDRRAATLLRQLAAWDPGLRLLPLEQARADAIAAYNDRQDARAWDHLDGDGPRLASTASDAAFLDRITVNWLRHHASRYDAMLDALAGHVGVREAERLVRAKVYAVIATTYPTLAGEVADQLRRRGLDPEPVLAPTGT